MNNRKYNDYTTYIPRLVTRINPKASITTEGLIELKRLINKTQQKLMDSLKHASININRETIRETDSIQAFKSIMYPPLHDYVFSFVMEKLEKFYTFQKTQTDKKRVTATEQASLVFPPSRFRTFSKRVGIERINDGATVIGAACLEACTRYIIERSFDNNMVITDTTVQATLRMLFEIKMLAQ
jgi:hypothetical protein